MDDDIHRNIKSGRAAITALLNQHDEECREMVSCLDDKEQLALLVASCADMIAHAITMNAEYDYRKAITSWRALRDDAEIRIRDLCVHKPYTDDLLAWKTSKESS